MVDADHVLIEPGASSTFALGREVTMMSGTVNGFTAGRAVYQVRRDVFRVVAEHGTSLSSVRPANASNFDTFALDTASCTISILHYAVVSRTCLGDEDLLERGRTNVVPALLVVKRWIGCELMSEADGSPSRLARF